MQRQDFAARRAGAWRARRRCGSRRRGSIGFSVRDSLDQVSRGSATVERPDVYYDLVCLLFCQDFGDKCRHGCALAAMLENPHELTVSSRSLPGSIGKIAGKRAFQRFCIDIGSQSLSIAPVANLAECLSAVERLPPLNDFSRGRQGVFQTLDVLYLISWYPRS